MNPTNIIDLAIHLSGHQKIAFSMDEAMKAGGSAWEQAKSSARGLWAGAKNMGDLTNLKARGTEFWNSHGDRIKDDAMYGAAGAGGLALLGAATAYRRPGESEGDYRKRRFRETLSSIATGAAVGVGGREGYKAYSNYNALTSPEGVAGLLVGKDGKPGGINMKIHKDPGYAKTLQNDLSDGTPSSIDAKALAQAMKAGKISPQKLMQDLVRSGLPEPEAVTFMQRLGLPVDNLLPGGNSTIHALPEGQRIAPPDPEEGIAAPEAPGVLNSGIPTKSEAIGAASGAAIGLGTAGVHHANNRFDPAAHLTGTRNLSNVVFGQSGLVNSDAYRKMYDIPEVLAVPGDPLTNTPGTPGVRGIPGTHPHSPLSQDISRFRTSLDEYNAALQQPTRVNPGVGAPQGGGNRANIPGLRSAVEDAFANIERSASGTIEIPGAGDVQQVRAPGGRNGSRYVFDDLDRTRFMEGRGGPEIGLARTGHKLRTAGSYGVRGVGFGAAGLGAGMGADWYARGQSAASDQDYIRTMSGRPPR